MSGGLPPLRDRHLAAGFIVVMYLLLGAFFAALLVTALSRNGVWAGAAALVGGALGAVVGVWRLRRTHENEGVDADTD